jgi:energy-coupling factor transport system ATP-binding protein
MGLDAYRKKLLEDYLHKIASLGRGMLLVSHDMAFVDRMAERVLTLENGQIQSDLWVKGEHAR